MTAEVSTQLNLPVLKRVKLKDFDLYSHNPDVEVHLEKPVFCVIGANGLGKTTFLNTINFGLTGTISDPSRSFKTADEYYALVKREAISRDYFSGRLKTGLLSLSAVEVTLAVGDMVVKVVRRCLGGGSIDKLEICIAEGEVEVYDSAHHDGLDEQYEKLICEYVGLETFSQYVFLSHFLWTFDESRHLLLWDETALNLALDISFGAGNYSVEDADKLRKKLSSADSRGRNSKFAAKQVADRMKQLREVLAKTQAIENENLPNKQELTEQYDRLVSRITECEDRVAQRKTLLRDADAKWANTSAALSELQIEYKRAFSVRLDESTRASFHPVVKSSISEDQCAVCGTEGVGTAIKSIVAECKCPVCQTQLKPQSGDGNGLLELQRIDSEIGKIRIELEAVLETRDSRATEMEASQLELRSAENELTEFEAIQPNMSDQVDMRAGADALKEQLKRYEKERGEFLEEGVEFYRQRDDIRKQLRTYEKKLKGQYDQRADGFIMRFRDLAEAFIGLPVDVELKPHGGASKSGYGLSLRLQDQPRVQQNTVSESQGFFLDIALRMALSEFMTAGPATLFIDTPEGALDITYEARAGVMFSKFVEDQNHILMTANLRSSHLVLRLAELQKNTDMQVVRLTEWTELSSVQMEEEHLFDEAYKQIEGALQ